MQNEFIEAIKTGNLESIRSLLERDPSLLNTQENGVSAIMLALYYGQKALADFLGSQAPALNFSEAVALGKIERARALLAETPALVNQYSPDGFPPLGFAAFFGQVDMLKLLLAAGADPNLQAQNPMQVAALHSAIAFRNAELATKMAKILVEAGANVHAKQQAGWTPLHEAAQNNYRDLVEFLLAHGADRTAKSEDGRTPLDLAAAQQFKEVIALLEAV